MNNSTQNWATDSLESIQNVSFIPNRILWDWSGGGIMYYGNYQFQVAQKWLKVDIWNQEDTPYPINDRFYPEVNYAIDASQWHTLLSPNTC